MSKEETFENMPDVETLVEIENSKKNLNELINRFNLFDKKQKSVAVINESYSKVL